MPTGQSSESKTQEQEDVDEDPDEISVVEIVTDHEDNDDDGNEMNNSSDSGKELQKTTDALPTGSPQASLQNARIPRIQITPISQDRSLFSSEQSVPMEESNDRLTLKSGISRKLNNIASTVGGAIAGVSQKFPVFVSNAPAAAGLFSGRDRENTTDTPKKKRKTNESGGKGFLEGILDKQIAHQEDQSSNSSSPSTPRQPSPVQQIQEP